NRSRAFHPRTDFRIGPLNVHSGVLDMAKIVIDGTEVDVPPEFTLLQAAEAAGAEIPRFCFHERLSIAGNCRMCLVELKGSPKPVASCAWGVRDCRAGPKGEPPVVNTKTPVVRKAREGVMEFLLVNHPLDSSIRIDSRGREVMRILPRVNDDVYEEWISDKTRHVVDGLKVQRLDQPYIRSRGQLRPASWPEAFQAIAAKVKASRPDRIGAIAGDLAAVEE